MSEENFKSAYELQKETAEALFKKCFMKDAPAIKDNADVDKIKSLCEKHAELINDFAHVKDINRAISELFDEVTDLFPTPNELDLAITRLSELYDREEAELRSKKLHSFRKVCVALHKNNEQVRPKSFAESVDTEEVQ